MNNVVNNKKSRSLPFAPIFLCLAFVLCFVVISIAMFANSAENAQNPQGSQCEQSAIAQAADPNTYTQSYSELSVYNAGTLDSDSMTQAVSDSQAITPNEGNAQKTTLDPSKSYDESGNIQYTLADGQVCSYRANKIMINTASDTPQTEIKEALANLGQNFCAMSVISNTIEQGETLLEVAYSGGADPEVLSDGLKDNEIISSANPDYLLTLCETDSTDSTDSQVDTARLAHATQTTATSETLTSAQTVALQTNALKSLSSQASLTSINAQDPKFDLAYTSNDPLLTYTWNLIGVGTYDAWDIAKTSGRVTVATIDSGVSYTHEDLSANLVDEKYAKNTVTNETGASAVNDTVSHGTAVAGIISAVADNNIGVAGISYNAKVLPIKALGSDNKLASSDVIEALDYITNLKKTSDDSDMKNIRVINMSLGAANPYIEDFDKAIQNAYDAGIVLVAAAGNDSKNTDQSKAISGITIEGYAYYPVSFDNVIGVSALKPSYEYETDESGGTYATLVDVEFDSSYSNYGAAVDLSAPGTDIISTCPPSASTEYMAYGQGSGTSFSAPLVSGAAALLFSQTMCTTPATIENVLESTALDRGDKGRDDYYGYGMLNLKKAVNKMSESASNSCSFGEWVTTVEPTCTLQGKQERTCSVCGTVESKTVDMLPHTEVADPAVEPTCTKPGKTQGSHCSVCSTVITKQTEIAATGHSYVDEVIAPTCTQAGYTKHTCSVCSGTYNDAEVSATGHTFGEWQTISAASVVQTGKQMRTCSACGTTEEQEIPKLYSGDGDRKIVYRLYNPITSEHLFTTGRDEYESLTNCDWQQEGVAWMDLSGEGVPVYRLYNANLGALGKMSHHYTASKEEADNLVLKHDWVYDNDGKPIFYSASTLDTDGEQTAMNGAVEVYRLYHDDLSAHMYTMDKSENDNLIAKHQWKAEGVGFYAIPVG